jgi:hypothetical protein
MGDQACVFCGAAEFSRDTDIAVLSETENLTRLSEALDELQAQCITIGQSLSRCVFLAATRSRRDISSTRIPGANSTVVRRAQGFF